MKIKEIASLIAILILLFFIYIEYELLVYDRDIKTYRKYAADCFLHDSQEYPVMYQCPKNRPDCKNTKANRNPNSCFCAIYNLFAPRLLVYKVKSNHKKLEFIKPVSMNAYIVPTLALEKADVFFGYGIFNDINFENITSDLYKKTTYAFDCGIRDVPDKNPLVVFKSECIGTDNYVLAGQNSSGKIHSFGEKLKELNLENKKVFIKMDIAGAEAEILEDLIKYSDNITGITLVTRLQDKNKFRKFMKSLPLMEKKFVLVYRNLLIAECTTDNKCKYMHPNYTRPIALTYINKNLVDEKYLPFNQDCSNKNAYSSPYNVKTFIPEYSINWRIVLYEKIRQLINKDKTP